MTQNSDLTYRPIEVLYEHVRALFRRNTMRSYPWLPAMMDPGFLERDCGLDLLYYKPGAWLAEICTQKDAESFIGGSKHTHWIDMRGCYAVYNVVLIDPLHWLSEDLHGRTEEMLDSENQSRVEGLAGKISRLKGLALDIESDTKDSNRYLDDHMMGEFDSSQGLLTGSMNRLNHMVSSGKGNRKLMCYIIGGLIILFFLAYYLVSKVTAK